MEPSPEMSSWLMETAASFHGARRRRFMAQAVEVLGLSQRRAARALGWSRDTVRKGLHELHSGITCLDNFSARGRKPIEVRLPALRADICDLVQDHLQTDPTFQTTPPLLPGVRRRGPPAVDRPQGLPRGPSAVGPDDHHQAQRLGVPTPAGDQVQAPKKLKETDAIFEHLSQVHRDAARSTDTLRLSLDAKAPVLIGPFSRGGKSRLGTAGADHDFKPWGRLTPFGLFLPEPKELNLYFTASKVTSDFIVDRLGEWWEANRSRFAGVDRLLLDLDNGPENRA